MPTKVQKMPVEELIKAEKPEADCHHMIRKVGARANEAGFITADMADSDVRNWLQAGYKLAHVQSLGIEPGGVNLLYVFIKD